MKILYGTTNQAKLESMKRIVETLGIEIVGLNDLDTSIPVVDETGKNPLSFIFNDQHVFNSMDASLMTESFMIVDKPHSKRVKGYPLDAIYVDCCTKQYYYDLEDKSVDHSAINNCFKDFFENAISSISQKN